VFATALFSERADQCRRWKDRGSYFDVLIFSDCMIDLLSDQLLVFPRDRVFRSSSCKLLYPIQNLMLIYLLFASALVYSITLRTVCRATTSHTESLLLLKLGVLRPAN
jgi:hypothetical protein